ncbi:hypothetical protein [Rubinisphaera brasiliensis]|uniref:Uncharacterized protein n=1 Tax=Rubinisphaera brasiliensis (strain ATCC 49424 / DSM 5305 / JCM 21570 / IAM 15109 / NBRC 103401 / IFAM 1448) TaxID=756272 RepID=F0SK27_RUBBR|nr:hypothetical protein [Rubinisphaera brasiliensis]ADY59754.1 hypothetical protein Plabr_2151 [Rubinisphaera brasiliensis DSM 5305]
MQTTTLTHCLTHQLPETGTSPMGPVCPKCKRFAYVDLPGQPLRSYWESQPGAYTLDRQPLFVYIRQTESVVLRSLRPDS